MGTARITKGSRPSWRPAKSGVTISSPCWCAAARVVPSTSWPARAVRRLEYALRHEDDPQAEHHDQPDAAGVAGEENHDVLLPLLAELFREVEAPQQGADELREDVGRPGMVQAADDSVGEEDRQAE